MTRVPVSSPAGHRQRYDAVVIGAGPAGAFTAANLASTGLRTLLLEKTRFPRPKLCGGCLAEPGCQVLRRFGVDETLFYKGTREVDRVEFRTGERRLGIRVRPFRLLDRSAFDQKIVRIAIDRGAEFRDQVKAIVRQDGTVDTKIASTKASVSETIHARVVVVADGLKGKSLDEYGGFPWAVQPSSHIGLGGIFAAMPEGFSDSAITMIHADHGYLGVAPLADGRADIAGAIDPRWLSRIGAGPALPCLLASFGIEPQTVPLLSRPLGAPHLTRHRRRVEDAGRVFLCGDSAGYLEPFTGEGITWALEAAELLTHHACEAVAGRYRPGNWTRALQRERRRRLLCHSATRLLRRPALVRGLATACDTLPVLTTGLSSVVRGLQKRTAVPEMSVI